MCGPASAWSIRFNVGPIGTRINIGKSWFRQAVFLIAAAFALSPWSSPLVAIGIGAFLSLVLKNPKPRLGQRLSEHFLQLSVILLGFDMSVTLVASTMITSAFWAAATVAGGILLGLLLGKALGIELRESILVTAGTAICGGTAIVAVGASTQAEEEDITVAIGTVFLLNTAALYLFPLVGHAMHLTEQQFGHWAGFAIHDVSSVVAAGEAYGQKALQIAVGAKLMRVIWILPMTWALAKLLSKHAGKYSAHNQNERKQPKTKVHVPWFIPAFLGACLIREHVPGMATIGSTFSRCGEAVLMLTFFLIGTDISRQTLASLTWRPVTQGIVLWVAISVATLLLATH